MCYYITPSVPCVFMSSYSSQLENSHNKEWVLITQVFGSAGQLDFICLEAVDAEWSISGPWGHISQPSAAAPVSQFAAVTVHDAFTLRQSYKREPALPAHLALLSDIILNGQRCSEGQTLWESLCESMTMHIKVFMFYKHAVIKKNTLLVNILTNAWFPEWRISIQIWMSVELLLNNIKKYL